MYNWKVGTFYATFIVLNGITAAWRIFSSGWPCRFSVTKILIFYVIWWFPPRVTIITGWWKESESLWMHAGWCCVSWIVWQKSKWGEMSNITFTPIQPGRSVTYKSNSKAGTFTSSWWLKVWKFLSLNV